MLKIIKGRIGKDRDEGFTLIELMVVVLIIAILMAIAIPTFLGARNSANARAAQSDLRNAFTTAKTLATDGNAFDLTLTDYSGAEPSLNWVNTAATATPKNTVSITGTTATDLYLSAQGADGACYWIHDNSYAAAPTQTQYATQKATACGTVVPTTGWGGSW